jgi:hypothetical protein
MRRLNAKQKKMLDSFFETIKHESGLAVRDIVQDLMPYDIWEELKALNDFETLYSHANNYLNELGYKF